MQRGAHATAWHARQSNRHSSPPLRRLAMVEDLDDCIYPPYGHGVGLVSTGSPRRCQHPGDRRGGDDHEWQLGFDARSGLSDIERRPKPSAELARSWVLGPAA